MTSDRLRDVEENLTLLEEQLAGLEKTKTLSPLEEQVRLRHRIDALKQEMRPVEAEYWQLVASSANQLEIPEPEAEVAVGEIVAAVTELEARPIPAYSDEVLILLRDIRDQMKAPGTPAAAKLKGVFSLTPPFFSPSYEVELDFGNLFRTHCPTFTRLIRGAAKK